MWRALAQNVMEVHGERLRLCKCSDDAVGDTVFDEVVVVDRVFDHELFVTQQVDIGVIFGISLWRGLDLLARETGEITLERLGSKNIP